MYGVRNGLHSFAMVISVGFAPFNSTTNSATFPSSLDLIPAPCSLTCNVLIRGRCPCTLTFSVPSAFVEALVLAK